MPEHRCPACKTELERYQYSDVTNRRMGEGWRCPVCRAKWKTDQELTDWQQAQARVDAEPHKICKICGQDVKTGHPVWQRSGIRTVVSVCAHCFVCPTCGSYAFQPDPEHHEVTCQTCQAHWSSTKEFETELVARAWELGLRKR